MPAEVPQNGGYLIAAYVVTPVILVGYMLRLWRRLGREGRKEKGERERSKERGVRA